MFRHRLLFLVCVAVLCNACASTPVIEEERADLAVEHLLQSISTALSTVHVRHVNDDFDLDLTKAEIELKTVVGKDLEEDLTISVVELEGERDEKFTQSLKVTLEPPDKKREASASRSSITHPRIVQALEVALDAAYLVARGARSGLDRLHAGEVPLEADAIEVAISFDVTTTNEGVPTISILGLNLTRSKELVHKLTLTFEIRSTGKTE